MLFIIIHNLRNWGKVIPTTYITYLLLAPLILYRIAVAKKSQQILSKKESRRKFVDSELEIRDFIWQGRRKVWKSGGGVGWGGT